LRTKFEHESQKVEKTSCTWLVYSGTEHLIMPCVFITVFHLNQAFTHQTLLSFCNQHAVPALSSEDMAVAESFVENCR
jgi:hypothetical protein